KKKKKKKKKKKRDKKSEIIVGRLWRSNEALQSIASTCKKYSIDLHNAKNRNTVLLVLTELCSLSRFKHISQAKAIMSYLVVTGQKFFNPTMTEPYPGYAIENIPLERPSKLHLFADPLVVYRLMITFEIHRDFETVLRLCQFHLFQTMWGHWTNEQRVSPLLKMLRVCRKVKHQRY
ncbi:hypothetical protein RFI_33295, partial [Reticulomyxa filosa]